MPRPPTWLLAGAAGLLLGGLARLPISAAVAQDLDDAAFLCRTFRTALEGSTAVDTADRTSEVGQWVARERPDGWRVHHVDFGIAPKPSGYAQAYASVCLVR